MKRPKCEPAVIVGDRHVVEELTRADDRQLFQVRLRDLRLITVVTVRQLGPPTVLLLKCDKNI